jgi:stage IV sporulation protein FB
MEISPLGAMVRLEDDGELRVGQRLVVLASGPAASLGLCWLSLFLSSHGWLPSDVGRRLFSTNLVILAGNLLPALPMDGGRILATILLQRISSAAVNSVMRLSGVLIGGALIALNVFVSMHLGGWNLSLGAAGCFLMYASALCTTSSALAELRMFMDRKIMLESKGVLTCKWKAVSEHLPLRRGVHMLVPGCFTVFVLVDQIKGEINDTVTENRLISAYLHDPGGDFSTFSKQCGK